MRAYGGNTGVGCRVYISPKSPHGDSKTGLVGAGLSTGGLAWISGRTSLAQEALSWLESPGFACI